MAVIKGYLEIAEQLLLNDMSDINEKDDEDDTPLHWAVLLGNTAAVHFLLANGADISVVNKYKNNVVMTACINQRLEILGLLISHLISIGKYEVALQQMTLIEAQMHQLMGQNTNLSETEGAKERSVRKRLKEIIN